MYILFPKFKFVMYSFFVRWYSEGIYTLPPPCLYSKKFRAYFSDSDTCGPLSCSKVSKLGTSWGLKYRSQIMFVAFWISLLGAMLLSVTFAALSNRKNDIEVAYWLKTDIQQNLNGTSYHRYLYAGSIIAVFDCKPHDHSYCTGLDRTIDYWVNPDLCAYHKSYCSSCAKAATSTVTLAFFGLLSMIPQMLVNLQRSTEAGDLNCQKWIGLYADIIGMFSTLIAVLQCYLQCFQNLFDGMKSEYGDSNYIKISLGPAYYCLVVATIMKLFDLWANWIVPVPIVHWDPDHPEYFDDNHKPIVTYKIDPTTGEYNIINNYNNNMVEPLNSNNIYNTIDNVSKSKESFDIIQNFNTYYISNKINKVLPIEDIEMN